MKFKTSIGDGAFLGLVVICLLTLCMYVFWAVTGVWWPAIVLTAVLVVVVAPIYFGTKYVLERENLNLYCGIFCRSVPYRNIISVTDADCVTPSFAMSHKRICLRYLDGENIRITYLSPTNRDAFREALNTAMQKSLATLKSQGVLSSETIEAVQAAKERLARDHETNRAEERALAIREDEAKTRVREDLAREIKKLDAIIDGNLDPNSVVLSQAQEDLIASRRAAERKLLKKVRKLKRKKDREVARAAARNARRVEYQEQLAAMQQDIETTEAAEPKQKKTADQKFADKERAKAEKIKSKQAKQQKKQEQKALADEQDCFEQESVLVEQKQDAKKPEISKIKSKTSDKINSPKTKKKNSTSQKSGSAAVISEDGQSKAAKLTKEQKASNKKFSKEVKQEAKKLKKEALAEAKAEKKTAEERLAKLAEKSNSKK